MKTVKRLEIMQHLRVSLIKLTMKLISLTVNLKGVLKLLYLRNRLIQRIMLNHNKQLRMNLQNNEIKSYHKKYKK